MNHDYLCPCAACNYERVVQEIKERYASSASGTYQFMDDPFPPQNTKTGRFKVHHPPYEQRSRTPRAVIQGNYRRRYDPISDMIEWQYKPWAETEWRTYYKVSMEMLQRDVMTFNTKITATKFHTAASAALSKERFYKIERVD